LTATISIPLVDLAWQHNEIAAELGPALEAAMTSGGFIGGPAVADFEAAFAALCGAKQCVGVANGTDALELALRAVGVGPGDNVIVPANTFIATVEAVVRIGARTVLVDCDDHHLIDVEQASSALPGARAVVPVYLYGQMTALEQLRDEAARHGCAIVVDAAQAQGASRDGQSISAGVSVAATSFYPGKNLGAYGDAGAVITDDDELARHVRLYSNHGSDVRYAHELMGANSRLDALQAIVLSTKLRRLEAWNDLRRAAADRYTKLLDGLPIKLPLTATGNTHVWHLYVIETAHRDAVLAALHADGVGAAIHYPTPIHLHKASASLGYARGSFPRAESACSSIISLPLYPGITEAQQQVVVESLRGALERVS
jgi:dTDP-4-amino-4,6-dideoxygalactose transaminase